MRKVSLTNFSSETLKTSNGPPRLLNPCIKPIIKTNNVSNLDTALCMTWERTFVFKHTQAIRMIPTNKFMSGL